jgi:hypothetical protein
MDVWDGLARRYAIVHADVETIGVKLILELLPGFTNQPP